MRAPGRRFASRWTIPARSRRCPTSTRWFGCTTRGPARSWVGARGTATPRRVWRLLPIGGSPAARSSPAGRTGRFARGGCRRRTRIGPSPRSSARSRRTNGGRCSWGRTPARFDPSTSMIGTGRLGRLRSRPRTAPRGRTGRPGFPRRRATGRRTTPRWKRWAPPGHPPSRRSLRSKNSRGGRLAFNASGERKRSSPTWPRLRRGPSGPPTRRAGTRRSSRGYPRRCSTTATWTSASTTTTTMATVPTRKTSRAEPTRTTPTLGGARRPW
mmetsp:Transcript_4867/g.21693  ORF Transcript_4867/g.21693 Transcript_4867/m.21693 type:complete len:270 (+) Transcript_4867:2591-3400(+)